MLDTSFGNNGIATTQVSPTYNFVTATTVQPDGKIILVGDSGEPATYKATVVRLNTDGTLDTSFGTGGNATITIPSAKSFGMDVALQDDGKIVVGARTWDNVSGNMVLARLNTDGSFDSSFGTNGVVIANSGGSDVLASVIIADDGKIYIAGDSDNNFSIARFNTDGALDNSFGTDGKVAFNFGIDHDIATTLGI
ncbi:delta-60 repeat domain-containing protein [Aequorivita marisscotiae]|uniref:Delta-60 repeat domain-containing protein n=2 Tax=Aequorivita marisscotiae TaxID=3040348 RepID=A0ABY8KZ95_9FLAO|nr:delta-60 repeat domain-containing protein [Aequorivita sp. Ant34-E75]WGF93535.1 delta-60 repeat domain-containing protein [Aequorivita sp. Ant34-E75]